MADDIIRVRSISQMHEMMGYAKPLHPLISVIPVSDFSMPPELVDVKMSSDLYYIGLKTGDCGMQYGRNHYDFQDGVLAFTSPNQVISISAEQNFDPNEGWMLFFHPDLIRSTPLGENIESYSFFSYETFEALHLSDKEKKTLNDCVDKIKEEYHERIDSHSQRVMVSSLELLLSYCLRFYERQFNTRSSQHKDVVSKVESFLKDYYKSGQLTEYGPPSIQLIADKVNLSPSYLSDLLRKETGRSAKDHINDFLVEKAKNMLLSSEDSIAQIAYGLGFSYPHYFSRLFKTKTGLSPQKYRELA